MAGTRNLGSLVVRLALELAEYKRQWQDAERTTVDGASKVGQAQKGATSAADALTDAARGQAGALGDAAGKAVELARGAGVATTAMAGLALGVGAGAAVLGTFAYAAYEGAKESKALADSLLLTGNYAGLVSGQLDRMAMSVASSIGGTVGDARQVLAGLVATGRFTVESLGEVGNAVQLVARFSGQTNETVLKDFASMGDGVAKWAAKHNEAYHFLDLATYRYIKQLEEQGETQDAIRVTSEALSKHLGGDLTQNLGVIERAWLAVSRAASSAWASMKEVGKPDTTQSILAKNSEYLQRAAGTYRPEDPRYQALQAVNQELFKRSEREQSTAATTSALAQATEEAIKADEAWGKIVDGLATKTERMNKELEAARKTAAKRNTPAADLAETERRIREKYADKGGVAADNKDLERQQRLLAELSGVQANYMQQLSDLVAMRKAGNISEERYVALVTELIAKQPMAKKLMDEQAKAVAAEAKANMEAAKAHEDHVNQLTKGIDKLEEENRKIADHNATLGQSKTAIAEVTAARLEEQAAALESLAIRKMEKDLDEGLYDLRMREAALLRQKARLTREGAAKEESLETLRQLQEEAVRTGKNVEDAIYQGLHDGFDRGGSFGKNIFHSLEEAARNTVFRFAAQILTSAIGLPTTAGQAAGGMVTSAGGSVLSSMLNGASAGGIGGLLGSAGAYAAAVPGLTTAAAGSQAAMLAAQTGVFGAEGLAATAAAGGSSLGAAFAAIPGWGWLVGGGLLLASSLLGKKGETRVGGQYTNTDLIGAPSGGQIDGATQAIAATIQSVNAALAGLGSSATLTELRSGLEESKNGKGFAYAGGILSTGAQFGQVFDGYMNRRGSMTNEQASAAFNEELKQVTLQALQAADIGGAFGAWLKSLGNIDELSGGALDADLARVTNYLQQKAALDERYYQATATDAEKAKRARDLERKSIDSTLLEQYDRITALEDERAATAAAAAAHAALVDQLTKARDSAFQAMDQIMGDVRNAVEAQRTQENAAYDAAVQNASAGIDALSESVSNLRGLADSLDASLRGMRLEEQAALTRRVAQSRIEATLAIARAGGKVTPTADLTDALQVVQQQNTKLFSNYSDFAFDYGKTAGEVADLKALTDDQLTVGERQLRTAQSELDLLEHNHREEMSRLDAIIASAQQQVDAAKGLTSGIGTIGQALSMLSVATSVAKTATGNLSVANGGTGNTADGPSMGPEAVRALVNSTLGPNPTADQMLVLAWQHRDSLNASDFDAAYSLAPGTAAAYAASKGVPAFAEGGAHAGGLAMVGERGRELAMMGPARVYNAGDTGDLMNTFAAMQQLLGAVVGELRDLRAETRGVLKQAKRTADSFENNTQGTTVLQVAVVA